MEPAQAQPGFLLTAGQHGSLQSLYHKALKVQLLISSIPSHLTFNDFTSAPESMPYLHLLAWLSVHLLYLPSS